MSMLMILLAIIGSIGGIALLTVLWSISCYNRFVHLKALNDEGWSGIDVQLKRRYDVIPNLIATVKGYSIHEKELLENIARFRAASMGAASIQDKSHAEAGLMQGLKSLFVVVEQYPDLKANENFLHLQKELSALEQDIQLSRRYYNGTVRNYNTAVSTFPAKIIAGTYGFAVAPYFELAGSHEREAPKVQF